jgi:hypothetical protein
MYLYELSMQEDNKTNYVYIVEIKNNLLIKYEDMYKEISVDMMK